MATVNNRREIPKSSVASARSTGGAPRRGSVTAGLGSFFVFDTCKPSDLKKAFDSAMEDDKAAEQNPLFQPLAPTLDDDLSRHSTSQQADESSYAAQRPDDANPSVHEGSFELAEGNSSPFSLDPPQAQSEMAEDDEEDAVAAPMATGYVRKAQTSRQGGQEDLSSKANGTSPATLQQPARPFIALRGTDSPLGTSSHRSPNPSPSHAQTPSGQASHAGGNASNQVSKTGLGASNPSTASSSTATTSSPTGSPPSGSPLASVSVGEYDYAEDQLDAMIDQLDMSALVEDDHGLTDWLREDAFASFQFAPEWLEMTLTMKSAGAAPGSGVSSIFGESSGFHGLFGPNVTHDLAPSPQPADEIESLFAKQRAESRKDGGSLQRSPSMRSNTQAAPLTKSPSLQRNATEGSDAQTIPVSQTSSPAVGGAEGGQKEGGMQPSTSQASLLSPAQPSLLSPAQPSLLSPAQPSLLPPAQPLASNTSPTTSGVLPIQHPLAMPPTISSVSSPFLLPSASSPSPSLSQLGTSGGTFLPAAQSRPSLLPQAASLLMPSSASPLLLPAPTTMPPAATLTAPAPAPSPYLLPSALPHTKPPASTPTPTPTPLLNKEEAALFITPLLSAPGVGERTEVLGAALYPLVRLLDPSSPFHSILHDSAALATTPLVVLKETEEVPASAGGKTAPPTFNVHVSLFTATPEDALDALTGIGTHAATFMTQWRMQQATTNPAEAQKAYSPLFPHSTAPLVVSKAKSPAPNTASATSPAPVVGQLTPSLDSPDTPLVLLTTLAVLNPQGKTKRVLKLIAIAYPLNMPQVYALGRLGAAPNAFVASSSPPFCYSPNYNIPAIPMDTMSAQDRATQTLSLPTEPLASSLFAALASAHGAVFLLPLRLPSLISSNTALMSSQLDAVLQAHVDGCGHVLRQMQRLHFHSGPVSGNPHIRLLALPGYSPLDLLDNSQAASPVALSTVWGQAMVWAQNHSVGLMKYKAYSEWASILTAHGALSSATSKAPTGSASLSTATSPPTWRVNPLLSHLAAQTHVLRMEALMTSFDQSGARPTSALTGGAGNASARGASKPGTNQAAAPTPSNVRQPSSVSSPMTPMQPMQQLSKPSYVKRIVAVIGCPGSGRSTFISRATHARASRQGSDLLMSTLSPTFMTSTLTGSGASAAGGPRAFADIFFDTRHFVLEFIETPVRSLNKIQFYKDINRAHAFVFVYAGVHPSPEEVLEMNDCLLDIFRAKSSSAATDTASLRLKALIAAPAPTPSPILSAGASRPKPTLLEDLPIVILGSKAPHSPSTGGILQRSASTGSNSSTGSVKSDGSGNVTVTLASSASSDSLLANTSSSQGALSQPLLTVAQLLQRHKLAHYYVDSLPTHHSELAKALQWLYNRIGEDALQKKGVRATNRPHHSGSVSVMPSPQRPPSAAPPLSLANSPNHNTQYPPTNTPSFKNAAPGSRHTVTGSTSDARVGAGSPAFGEHPNDMPSSSSSSRASLPASGTAGQRATIAGAPGGAQKAVVDSAASIELFMNVEALVLRMRGQAAPGVAVPSTPLVICDRKMESNGVWTPVPNTGIDSPSPSPAYYGDDDTTSSSSSNKKVKMLGKCFVGMEAVEWVVEHVVKPERLPTAPQQGSAGSYVISPSQLRSEAINRLQQLLDLSVMRSVFGASDSGRFLDSPDSFYRFQMDEDNESVLNMRKIWIGEVEHGEVEALATWLFQKIQPYISSAEPPSANAGTSNLFLIDGEAFIQSGLFNELLLFSAKLQRVPLLHLSHAQKVAFWINVYNILAIHINIQHGHVGKSKSKRKFCHSKVFYQISGHVYSLDDILHGILRGNRKNPISGKYQFKPNDPRSKFVLHHDTTSSLLPNLYSGGPLVSGQVIGSGVASTAGASTTAGGQTGQNLSVSASVLPPFDPRIHMALTTLTRTSPFIAPMKAQTLDARLDALASAFLKVELDVNFKNSSLSLPYCFNLYKADFGKLAQPLLTFLSRFLDSERAKSVLFLANKIKEKDLKSKSEDPTPSSPRILRL